MTLIRTYVLAALTALGVFGALSVGTATPTKASPCNDGFINPLTKTAWNCIFPISIAGVRVGSDGGIHDENIGSPLCACLVGAIPKIGIKVSFWTPNRMIDTVSNPGCMMALGTKLMSFGGRLQGQKSSDSSRATQYTHQQMHYYIAPLFAMLNLFTDIPCLGDEAGFDVAMISEILPTYQNEVLGAAINPEAILFGNPAAVLACMADAASSAVGRSLNTLFWCTGGWGSVYPLGGSSASADYAEANAHIASKQIFMMGRLGLLRIDNKNGCSGIPAPIWRKSRFKLQEMEPVKMGRCVNIGRPGLLWTAAKHPPHKDNFAWQVFEKRICCMSILGN